MEEEACCPSVLSEIIVIMALNILKNKLSSGSNTKNFDESNFLAETTSTILWWILLVQKYEFLEIQD